MKSKTIIYEAAFGDSAPTPAAAAVAPAPDRRPRWRRAQFFLERVLRMTLSTTQRMTAGMTRRTPRRLHLCESLPLGDRRFVAVVEFEKARFLVGGTSASLVLLARLGENPQENEEKIKGKNGLPPAASLAPETSGGAQP